MDSHPRSRGQGRGRGRGRGRGGGGRWRNNNSSSNNYYGRGGGQHTSRRQNHHQPPLRGVTRSAPAPPYSLPIPDKLISIENSDDTDEYNFLTIAVEGCAHGNLDEIYRAISESSQAQTQPVDLLLCCGDFQSLRNEADYDTLAVPDKYKSMGDFYKYYKGEKKVPIPTVFIGGNHEASGYLQELFYGGWAAPGMYYLGSAGVISYGGVRIGGLSGIYKDYNHELGHYEVPPYDRSSLRSVYHVRNVEAYRLAQIMEPLDIVLSHDWPRGIEQHGDTERLLRKKTFFRQEVMDNNLGSPVNEFLLNVLKPKFWFSAHLHVKFEAQVRHAVPTKESEPTSDMNEPSDEASLAASTSLPTTKFVGIESESCVDGTKSLTEQMTSFLALDKCLPRRQYLQILKVPRPTSEAGKKPKFQFDLEWLTILRKTAYLTNNKRVKTSMPNTAMPVSHEEKAETVQLLRRSLCDISDENLLDIPDNFAITVPPFPIKMDHGSMKRGCMVGNPQTDAFLAMLGLHHTVTVPYNTPNVIDSNEILLEDDGDDTKDNVGLSDQKVSSRLAADDNEISLDSDESVVSPERPVIAQNASASEPTKYASDKDEIDLESDDGESSVPCVAKKPRV